MKEKISVFFPLRAGSFRAKHKNTRPFLPDGRSLFQLKMSQLVGLLDEVDEIVVSTNDNEVESQFFEFENQKIKLIKRPEPLCLSTTKVVDLINYVPQVTLGSTILWVHATAPFCDTQDYQQALKLFCLNHASGNHDSLMSVNKIQQFLWDEQAKKVINVDRDINPWPNTQDLDPIYEINHAFYISTKDNYLQYQDRIGKNPYLFISEAEKKIDIDWEDDFIFAQNVAVALREKYGW